MDYPELLKSLADPNRGIDYTCAEQVFNAVIHADPDKLLDELDCAQCLEPDEIEELLAMPLKSVPVTARDVLFAMTTLIHLHQIQVRVTPRILPPWDEIESAFPVGSVHSGEFVRKVKGGYLVCLSTPSFSINAFLPASDSIPASLDELSDARFCIEELHESQRYIILAIES